MGDGSRVGALWALALILYLGSVLHAGVVHRPLHGDGCGFLVGKLRHPDKTPWALLRDRAFLVTQWPLDLALRAGVRDLPTCLALHSAGLLYVTPLAVVAGLLAARGDVALQLLVLLGLGGILANFDIPGFPEPQTAGGLVLLASVLLLRRGAVGWPTAALLLIVAWLLMRCYEPVVLSLALLSWLCTARVRRGDVRGRLAMVFLGASALAFLAGAGFALRELLFSHDPERLAAGCSSLGTFKWLHPGVVYAAAAGLLFALSRVPGRRGRLMTTLFAAASLAYGLLPVVAPWFTYVAWHYHARLLVTLPLALLVLAAHALSRRSSVVGEAELRRAAVFALVVVCSQAVFHIGVSYRWSQFLDSYAVALTRHEGLVSLDEVQSELRWGRLFDWGWTNPGLSILLSPGGRVQSMVHCARTAWQPFDPGRLDGLPKLEPFGVDYSRYAAALARRGAAASGTVSAP